MPDGPGAVQRRNLLTPPVWRRQPPGREDRACESYVSLNRSLGFEGSGGVSAEIQWETYYPDSELFLQKCVHKLSETSCSVKAY